jgi:hypothetical protein
VLGIGHPRLSQLTASVRSHALMSGGRYWSNVNVALSETIN